MSYTTCPQAAGPLKAAITTLLMELNRTNNACFSVDLQNKNNGPNFYNSFETALGPVYTALANLSSACPADSTIIAGFKSSLDEIATNIGMNISICYAAISGGYLQSGPQCASPALGMIASQPCAQGQSCNLSFHPVPAWTGPGGLLSQIIAYCSPPIITFNNSAPYQINTTKVDSNGFVPLNKELTWDPQTLEWQIAKGAVSAEGIIGDVITNKAVPIQVLGTTVFTLDFTTSPVGVIPIANSGFKATSISDGIGGSVISVVAAPTVTFNTVAALTSPAGSGAFITPNANLISSGASWTIKNDAEGTIGVATTPKAVPFQINGTTIFTLDFTTSPVGVMPVANSGFKATSISNGIGGSVVNVVAAPAVTFQNNTLYTINISGTDGNAFSTMTGGLSCSAGGCQIAAGTGVGTIDDLQVASPVTFNGVNASGVQVFSFQVTFNGTSVVPVTQTNKQDVNVSATFNSNIYVVKIAPATISFVNTTPSEVDMVIDQAAFSQFSSGSYTNGAYPIGTNCTAITPCEGVIGDLLNTGSLVPFKSGGKQVFTVDFTKSPPVVGSILPGYSVIPIENSDGGYRLEISYTIAVNVSLTGGLSQIVQDRVAPANNITTLPPNFMSINFVESISPEIQNTFNKMIHFVMAANITIPTIATLTTVYSASPLALGGSSPLLLDTNISKFWNQSLAGSITVGFSSDKVTKLTFSGSNLTIESFPSGASFSLSQKAVAQVQLLGYVADAINPENRDATTITLASPEVNLIPLYTFIGTGGPNLAADLNVGTVTTTGFSFTFALPTTVTSAVMRLVSGSSITITDATQGKGKNQIVFNMSGDITGASVTGTFYGLSILTGTAVVNTSGTPSITITGTMQSGIESFFFTQAITGQINLLLQ